MDSKFVISHSGPIGSKGQQNTAAAFFARKSAAVTATSKGPTNSPLHQSTSREVKHEVNHVSNFAGILAKCPPPAPSALLKKLQEDPVNTQHGKVRVILRVANSGVLDPDKPANFRIDQKKRQVTLIDPTHSKEDSKVNVAAPKMFAFDGLFTDEDAQPEVASSALTDSVHGVVSGVDGCLFAFGHASLGKTYTMIGSDESSKTLGVIPSAIAWLFRAIKERKETKNARFAVRVSALEIGGQNEEVRDLLNGQAASESDNDAPPSQFFPVNHHQANGITANLTELRCSNAERAGYYLDAALTARSTNMAADLTGRDSHFVFSLHVYQYSVENNKKGGGCGVIGGRSRLHLIDFGCCDRTKTSGGNITLSGLGNVILGIFNGQRHLPFKESKVTQMLKECLGSFTCQATMVAHVTPEPSHYSETLHTTQLASRIHRMRRKKAAKTGSTSNGSGGSGSSDDLKMNRLVKLASSSSEFTDPSSSEQSCDTVIFVGSRDDDGTDLEHPPVFLPNLNSGDNRGHMAKVLRGTSAELKHPKSSTLERKRHSKSPASSQNGLRICSPTFQQPQRLRPGSVGSTPTHSWKQQQQLLLTRGMVVSGGGSLPRTPKGKMPLTGRVAGYRQQPQPQCWPLQQQQFDPNMAIYGYMDDQKISMIQQWVDCQANQRHVVHQHQHAKAMMQQKQKEPEPFAWLNEPSQETEDGCKVLTQFKTVESDDSADDIIAVVQHHASVDVHVEQPCKSAVQVTPPLSPHIIVPDDKETIDSVLDEEKIEPDKPTVEIKTFDELYTHCEQLVETLSQASEELKQRESKESSEENLNVTVSSLDANKLHFASKNHRFSPSSASSAAAVFSELSVNQVKVCEDTTKFDQLAKLHELYQSVSSINDKAKTHLEEAKNRNEIKSSCLSLSALMTDLERISMNSDANSLCSEPVKMYDYNDFQHNNTDNVNLDDLFDFCNKNTTVSLGDLSNTKELVARSDSPILEGIDQELAKYAKLKDLEQAYQPGNMLRNPDGASNPDLNSNKMSLRRSPGNGRSGSEPEEEFDLNRPQPQQPRLASDGQSSSASGSSSVPSKSSPSGCSSMSSSSNETSARGHQQPPAASNTVLHRPQTNKRSSRDERTVLGKSQSTDTSSEIEIWQKKPAEKQPQQPQLTEAVVPAPSSKKVPKFSRLFKLSRSPLKVIQESNRRSKSADSRSTMKPAQPPKADKKPSQKLKLSDKKVSSSTNSLKQSKNAKGTSSSIVCSTPTTTTIAASKHRLAAVIPPSPYAIPTAPRFSKSTASTASSDSGHDSGIFKSSHSRFIKTCTFVKLRGNKSGLGAGDKVGKTGGGGALPLNNTLTTNKRVSQRKSSGYESSAGGVDSSERDSIDSLKGLDNDQQQKILEPINVMKYEATFIQKMDERWRSNEVKRLQQQQKELKTDLQVAKDRIQAGKNSWSFGCHVADSVESGIVKPTDPAIVEALQKETLILSKRVDAAKSHALLTTAFDVDQASIQRLSSPLTNKLLDNCCTTDCEPAENLLLTPKTTQETEIF